MLPMGEIHEIFAEYARMRENGMDAKAALYALRIYIEPLSKHDKQDLAKQVRTWEASGAGQMAYASPRSEQPVQPVQQPSKKPSPIRKLGADDNNSANQNANWVACPNCGKTNQKHEVFCYSCGQLLEPSRAGQDTKHFADTDPSLVSEEYFGPDSVLMLRLRGSSANFETRPQLRDHELFIGRSAAGGAMAPDVDLTSYNAGDLGVSRLHTSLQYDSEHNAIQVADLGSANGTFINGQRLHPKEIRVLRHGDELRLGKLVLKVSFRHPGRPLD
jgi:hypothetical protein